MAGVATGGRGMGMYPSNIAGGVAAVNSAMTMAATTKLGALTNNTRHLNYSAVNHHHNQNHSAQVLSGLGTGTAAYGATGSNLSSTSSSSGVGTITNNSNGSSSQATGTASEQAPAGNNNSYSHQSLPRHFHRGGTPAQPTGNEEESNGLPSSGIVMGPSHHHQTMSNKRQGGAGLSGPLYTHHTHLSNANGMQQLTPNGYHYSQKSKNGLNGISTVSNGMFGSSSPTLNPIPNSRYLNQQQRNNQPEQQQGRALSSYYSTLRSQPPPPPLPSQNSSLYHQAVPANVTSNGGDQLSAIHPPKQFDSYYYHPATVGRGSPALLSNVVVNDRQRPNSSGAVIDALNHANCNGIPSSRSSSKLGENRTAYPDFPPQQGSSCVPSHPQTRSSSVMSSHGPMKTPPISNPTDYAILKFNTNNIGAEIDV